MEKEIPELIVGIIFLILIINSIALWSIATSNTSQISQIRSDKPSGNSDTTEPDTSSRSPVATTVVTATPTTPPLKNPSANNTKTLTPVPTTGSIVSFETPQPVPQETHLQVQPDIARRTEEGYTTVYSISDQNVTNQMARIIVNVIKPPLMIDFDFEPYNTTDIKFIEGKIVSTPFHKNLEVKRANENSWFTITVRDKDTNEILAQDGIGNVYGLQSPKNLVILRYGNISIENKGEYGQITMTVKMKK